MNHPQVVKEQATGLLLPAPAPKWPRFNLSRMAWLVIIVPFFAGEDPLDQRAGLGLRLPGWTDGRGPASHYHYLKKLGKIGRSGRGDSETKGIESCGGPWERVLTSRWHRECHPSLHTAHPRVKADHGQDFPVFVWRQQTGVDADLHGFPDDLPVSCQTFITEKNDPAILAGYPELRTDSGAVGFEGLTVHEYRGTFLSPQKSDHLLGVSHNAGRITIFLQKLLQTLTDRFMGH
jgi:hypothetical protein